MWNVKSLIMSALRPGRLSRSRAETLPFYVVCEQTGPMEERYKNAITKVLGSAGTVLAAYLLRITDDVNGDQKRVALALVFEGCSPDKVVISECATVFKALFAQSQPLDIIALDETMSRVIAKKYKPFFVVHSGL